MSAFSDWNGPGGGGPYGPIIELIKQIELEVSNLTNKLNIEIQRLNGHEGNDADAHNVANRINNAITTLTNIMNNITATMRDQATAIARDYTNGQLSTVKADYAAKISAVDVKADNTIVELSKEITQRLQGDNALRAAINDLQSLLNTTSKTLSVDIIKAATQSIIKIQNTIEIFDIWAGEVNLSNKLDFVKFRYVASVAYPNQDHSNYVLILGKLSETYKPTMFSATAVLPKPGRAYIKWVNTKPWNAIVDMTPNITNDSSDVYTGVLTAHCSKTPDRGKIKIGLYHSTTTSGDHHVYLGIEVEETIGATIAGGHISGMNFYVAGINFEPLTADFPAGAVTEIAWIEVSVDNSFVVNNITINGQLAMNQLVDTDGNNIIGVDEDNLIIGDGAKPREIHLFSSERIDVTHADLSHHDVAYLTDLSQSVYWQSALRIIGDNLTVLNAETVTTDGNNHIITWDATSANNVPGYYLTDPTSPDPGGYIFQDGDMALVKDSGEPKVRIPDGRVNGIITNPSSTFTLAQLTNVDPDEIKYIAGGGRGTTVIDNEGNYGELDHYDVATELVTINLLADDSTLFAYTEPAYAHFTAGAFVLGQIVHIPATFDGYIHDVSYEWSGVHSLPVIRDGDKHYYIESYITWTVHHENNVTVNYSGNPWDYVDLQMEGFRSADRQDEIDLTLEALGTVQPDFGERQATMSFALPEQSPKIISNPAYIHNRPWSGVALLDGGSFIEPLIYSGWLADGGDFTGLLAAMQPPLSVPAVPSDQSYRNVIFRIWRGKYTDMPEVQSSVPASVWSNYKFTLRWCTDRKVMLFSDGERIYELGPLIVEYDNPNVKSEFFHEHDGGGYRLTTDNTISFVGGNTDAGPMKQELYAINKLTRIGTRIIQTLDGIFYTKGRDTSAFTAADELIVRSDLGIFVPTPPVTADVTYMLSVLNNAISWQAMPLPVALGGTGADTATGAITNLGIAPSTSPDLTGTPTAPTATAGTNTTQIATTAFVTTAVANEASARDTAIANAKLAIQSWFAAVNSKTDLPDPASITDRSVSYLCRVINDTIAANIGVWQLIPSATVWTYFSSSADFVDQVELATEMAKKVDLAQGTSNAGKALVVGTNGNVTLGAVPAPLNSPDLTGTPQSVTPATSANNRQIATTAFVKAAISSAGGGGGGEFTFICDTQVKFDAWVTKASGNDYTSVLVKGNFTASNGYSLNLTTTGTKVIVGVDNPVLTFTNNYGINYDTRPDHGSKIEGITVRISTDHTGNYYNIGFVRCTNLTDCTAIISITSTLAYGFYDCTNLINCRGQATKFDNSNKDLFCVGFRSCDNLLYCVGSGGAFGPSSGYGFYECTRLSYCRAYGTTGNLSLGFGFGYLDCYGMDHCSTYAGVSSTAVYYRSYATLTGTTYPAADTPVGGFNSSAII
jgi:hypothetical protein